MTYQEELPYEKFLKQGATMLSDRELLAIILRTGTKDADVMEVSAQILALADTKPKGGLLGLHDITLDQLTRIRGIGMVKAVRIKCLTELSLRISREKAKQSLYFDQPQTVADYYMEQLRHQPTETVILVSLDSKLRLLRECVISKGSARMSLISPREIFIEALQDKAAHIMLIHNHPSGDPTPSHSDLELTDQVREAGERVGIFLLDHVIIGDQRYVSFKEQHHL
ncbi:MAG: DNA repair protein RadC [Clostridium sp.]|jgi:DNA repair protein RadC|nr:DNA repair protein RadC [Clostridium sp.]